MFDIFMITYDEPNGDTNWDALHSRFPTARRVHGVKGILNAHRQCAASTHGRMFWVVDGDTEVLGSFAFTYTPPHHQQDFIHVWRARNPVNGLMYGYGGIKLLPTQIVTDAPAMATDMTTGLSTMFVVMPELASITHFNSSEFNAWRGAFRECVKLSAGVIDRQVSDETTKRLDFWSTMGGNKQYGDYVLAGARAGIEYGTTHSGDTEKLKMVNDFDWLRTEFFRIYNK